jgi:hypothetical protein
MMDELESWRTKELRRINMSVAAIVFFVVYPISIIFGINDGLSIWQQIFYSFGKALIAYFSFLGVAWYCLYVIAPYVVKTDISRSPSVPIVRKVISAK